jgi:hypothetical protein
MDPNHSKLQSREQQATHVQAQSNQQQQGKDFASVEDLLRHDASQQHPSDSLERRVAKSIEAEPRPRRRWWQKLFR